LLPAAQIYFCHFMKPIPPKNLKADSKYTLLLARYPVHLLHDLILGVLLGSFLVIGLQSPPNDPPTLILKLDEEDTLVHEPDQAPTLPVVGSPGATDDSDGDGIPNDWETAHSHNPNNADDAASDFDNDGLTTLQEYQLWNRINGQAGNPLGKWTQETIPMPNVLPDTQNYSDLSLHTSAVRTANDSGQIVVEHHSRWFDNDLNSYDSKKAITVINGDGTQHVINLPDKNSGFTRVMDINDRGDVLLQWHGDGYNEYESYFWESDGTITQLTQHGNPCRAEKMNNFGDWVGSEFINGQWKPVQVIYGFNVFPTNTLTNAAIVDINDYGQIVGYYSDPFSGHYTTFTQLGSMFFATNRSIDVAYLQSRSFYRSYASSINQSGAVVSAGFGSFSQYTNDDGTSAFMFDGSYHEINVLENQMFSSPMDFSDEGMVLLTADDYNSNVGVFLWKDSVSVNPMQLLAPESITPNVSSVSVTKLTPKGKIIFSGGTNYDRAVSIITLTQNQDGDGDGMPDDWEEFYGFNPYANDSFLDYDSDGTSNLGEFLLRSDPQNAPVIDANGNVIDTRPGVDTDGDGIPNNWEYVNGMNYQDPADAPLDFDRDGYTNLQEFYLNTDPRGAPSYRIRKLGPFTGASSVDLNNVTLGNGVVNGSPTYFNGDQITEQVFFPAYSATGGGRPALWSQARSANVGQLSLYTANTNESRSIVAQSPSGAMLTRHGYNPVIFTYWSSPTATPINLSDATIANNINNLSNVILSPSGNYLVAVRATASNSSINEPIVWKMPSSSSLTYKPVVLSAPDGASFNLWSQAHINDFGIISANGTVAGQTRPLVWTLNAAGTSVQSAILPTLTGGTYAYTVGLSNHSNPIIAGYATITGNKFRATVWKYNSPTSQIATNLGTLKNGNTSQIVKISPNGTLAGSSNTLVNNALKNQIFCATPIIPSNSSNIDPAQYILAPQGQAATNASTIANLTDSGEILTRYYTYSPAYQQSISLLRHGRAHPLENILPISSGYTLRGILSINPQGTLLVSAWKDNLSETLLLTPDRDTDDDGLPDAFENANQFNAFVKNNLNTDTDNDGLTDLLEYTNATNPRLADTDSDGMKDGWEVSWGLNPLDPSDASLDPDGDRVTNLRESQINTNPTGIYRTEVVYTHEGEFGYGINAISDEGEIIISSFDTLNTNTEYVDTGACYASMTSFPNTLLSTHQSGTWQSSSTVSTTALPPSKYDVSYDYAWNWLGYSQQFINFYFDSPRHQINAVHNFSGYRSYEENGNNIGSFETVALQSNVFDFDQSDPDSTFSSSITWESIASNLGAQITDNSYYDENGDYIEDITNQGVLDEYETINPLPNCISPDGCHRIHSTSNERLIHLNEKGELVEVIPYYDNWTKINNAGILARCETQYIQATSGFPAHYEVQLVTYSQDYGNMSCNLTAISEGITKFYYPQIIGFSDDQKILLAQYDYTNATHRFEYYLVDFSTQTIKKVKQPGLGNEYFTHLSTTNGRMVGAGSKPWQITPDGSCIRIEALRIKNTLSAPQQALNALYPRGVNPMHITPDGAITATTYDNQNRLQIILITLENDGNGNGLSDDWETSEIQQLIAENPAQWGFLEALGVLNANTSYWQDGFTATQSYNLGFSNDWRELSKTTDTDFDGVPDIEDADPLDWVVDWKPAGEATYAVIELDQVNYRGMQTWNPNDPYDGFTASIGDTGTILWNDQLRTVDREGRETWSERSRVWTSGNWSDDIREQPTTFDSISLFGLYSPDGNNFVTVSGTASPLSPPIYRSFTKPSAVCGESIVGDGEYVGDIRDLPRIVHSYDAQGNEYTETLYDGVKKIFSSNVATVWIKSPSQIWSASPIADQPSIDTLSIVPSIFCYDEWEAVFYHAVSSPAGALAVLGGDHLFPSRKWQVWQESNTPGVGPALWETPYRDGNSQLLIKAVNDYGVAVGERITGTETFWGQIDAVVIKNGIETILPESSGAFTFGASICHINKNDPDSHSRLAVGGSSLWVQKENAWHQAEHPPTMANIIAIAKNGLILGTRTIWRNGISIPLDKLVENQKISPTNSAPRYTNLRAYAMNGEGAIVALADDANSTDGLGKTLPLLAPIEIIDIKDASMTKDDVYINPKKSITDINLKSIAWIEPHKKAEDVNPSAYDPGDDPQMPQLEVRIKGLSPELIIEWKFKCKYARPNGRNVSGDAYTSDEVKVPFIEGFPEGDVTQILSGNETWNVHQDYENIPFFGGDALLNFGIKTPSGSTLLPTTTLSFRIAGKNPDDTRCRKYIDKGVVDRVPQTTNPMWYAYAIAKEETKWEGGEIYYNQFFARGMQVNRKQASGESIEHWKLHRWDQGRGKEGIPNWNDDAGGPGGFGIKQVTGWLGQVNPGPGDVPREVIWNWKKNIDGGLNEMIKKHNEARTYMQKQRAASSEPVPAHKVENVIFTDGTARTMEDAVAIKAYNGSSKSNIPDPDNEPEGEF
jgi:hypothetical protein